MIASQGVDKRMDEWMDGWHRVCVALIAFMHRTANIASYLIISDTIIQVYRTDEQFLQEKKKKS